MSVEWQAAIASFALESNLSTSRPIMAAGTIPKFESASSAAYLWIAIEDMPKSIRPGDLLHLGSGIRDGDKVFPAPLPTASFMRAMKYCFRILGSSVSRICWTRG